MCVFGSSFVRFLPWISKGLNVARNVIPLYEGAKPVISGAKKFLNRFNNHGASVNENAISKERIIIDYPRDKKVIKQVKSEQVKKLRVVQSSLFKFFSIISIYSFCLDSNVF